MVCSSYWPIAECRVCGNSKLKPIIDLGEQELTGRFPAHPGEKITSGPLAIVGCDTAKGCGLVQLAHSYDLDEMYGETYGYRSGLNQNMVAHLSEKVSEILDRGWLTDGDIVVDIGSNDGTTLGFYPEGRYKLVGIDPAVKKFSRYYRPDIMKISDFFSKKIFDSLFRDKLATIVTSFSMFYDLEKPVKFAQDISAILANDGVWCFEQSYLPSMLASNSFDTICHEHLEYYALTQIEFILRKVGMEILDVSFNDVNGGSFSVYAGKVGGPHQANKTAIEEVLAQEQALFGDAKSPFDAFKSRIEEERHALMSFLEKAKEEGKTVAGLGASTKGNVLLQYYGIGPELIPSIGEVNPDKFGCFTPGTHIPICSEEEVLASNPDYLVILPWHFRGFFEKQASLQGRTLIFPLPNFEIVHIDSGRSQAGG